MAKFIDIGKEREDIQQIFDEVLEKTSIPKWIEFRLLGNNKLKQLYKVQKLNELYEVLSEGVNFAIVIAEDIFDQLTDDMKYLTFEEALNGVSVNMDNDKISLEQPDFTTFSSLLQIKGSDELIRYKESVKSLLDAKEQKEKDEKEAKKQKKSKKKF